MLDGCTLALTTLELLTDWLFGGVSLYKYYRDDDKMCDLLELVSRLCPRLCRLFADGGAPMGARTCAADALERFGCFLLGQWCEDPKEYNKIHERAEALVALVDESGATELCAGLSTDPTLAFDARMSASRARELGRVARRLDSTVDEMRTLIEDE